MVQRVALRASGIIGVVAFALGCGGLLDDDVRQCTWRSDKVCAQHFETRFDDPSLETVQREQGRVLVHAACDRGEPLACRVYGVEVGFSRPGFPARPAEALDALEMACAQSDGEACFQIARLSTQPGPQQDFERALLIYRSRCDEQNSGSCNNLGFMVENGQGLPADLTAAGELYDKACRLGDKLACSNRALMLDLGRGVEMNKVRAQEIWEDLCSSARPKACFRLANSLRDSKQDLARPTALTEQACNDGHQPACVTLGFDFKLGRGRQVDLEKSFAIWLEACAQREGEGCDGAAVAYDHGEGVDQDVAQARVLFKKGCDLGFGGACVNLAIHEPEQAPLLVRLACEYGSRRGCNEHGLNESKQGNQANARAAFSKACDLGDLDTCRSLGRDLENQKPLDFDAAFRAYMRACEGGVGEVCGIAASMLKDPAEARKVYQKGCALGHAASCKKL